MANKATRLKRLHRREGSAQPAAPLAPHTARCECTGCQRKDQDRVHRAQIGRDKRARRDHAGAPDPQYRADWRITLKRLVAYMDLHVVEFRRRKVTSLDMLPQWLDHLDDAGPVSRIDGTVLYEALLALEMLQPLAGRLVRRCCIDGRSQREVASEEYVDHSTISRQLRSACDDLLDLYGVLVALEQRRAAVTA